MSTVAPSDSASNSTTKRRNRPGRNARQAAKGQGGATSEAPSKASFFASQAPADPVPQPGRYPVVFRTSVEEPSSDVAFSYTPATFEGVLEDLPGRYADNPRYAEFAGNAVIDDSVFEKEVRQMFVLAVLQQTVFSHVNMRLSLGDFSAIAATEVPLFSSLSAVVKQFGEFSDPSLGSRFLLHDYRSTVHALMRLALQITEDSDQTTEAIRRSWLPTRAGDERTKAIIAAVFSDWVFKRLDVRIPPEKLRPYVFEGLPPPVEALKAAFGTKPDRFDFLFKTWGNEGQTVTLLSANVEALTELGLPWDKPSAGHLRYELVPKAEFPALVDTLLRKRPMYDKFFNMVSSTASRSVACGSHAQLAEVSVPTPGVTMVRTHVAMSAPELSLLSCFPVSSIHDDFGPKNVKVTTSVPISNRATEFLQLDWKQ